MFRGITNASLDERGRFAMPARYRDTFRERAGGRLVVTSDLIDPCLLVYMEPDYLEVERQLQELSSTRPSVRYWLRQMIGHATEVELDGNGRVLIPQELRDQAQLEKKVVVVGQGRKLELWSDEGWQKVMSAPPKTDEQRVNDLQELDGIQL